MKDQKETVELSERDAELKVNGILEEYFSIHDQREALDCLAEVAPRLPVWSVTN